jgi:hypothetical protein
MHDRGWIFAGLLLFLALATLPVWHNLAAGNPHQPPDLKLPLHEKECVAPVTYMKTAHMKLLSEWRDQVVRNNIRTFTAFNGQVYTISLSGTCLQQCHADKAQFCDRCHAYNGVREPYCWDCHIDPKSANQSAATGTALRTGEQDGRR